MEKETGEVRIIIPDLLLERETERAVLLYPAELVRGGWEEAWPLLLPEVMWFPKSHCQVSADSFPEVRPMFGEVLYAFTPWICSREQKFEWLQAIFNRRMGGDARPSGWERVEELVWRERRIKEGMSVLRGLSQTVDSERQARDKIVSFPGFDIERRVKDFVWENRSIWTALPPAQKISSGAIRSEAVTSGVDLAREVEKPPSAKPKPRQHPWQGGRRKFTPDK